MDGPHGNSPLTRETILKEFSILNEKLREEGVIGEICVFGGTAIVLAFDARLSPKDVDAVFKPPDVFRRRAREIAEEIGIPGDWLNDGVKA
jgi:methylmalonyl-CoA mutase cobalamin-binding subunit